MDFGRLDRPLNDQTLKRCASFDGGTRIANRFIAETFCRWTKDCLCLDTPWIERPFSESRRAASVIHFEHVNRARLKLRRRNTWQHTVLRFIVKTVAKIISFS